MTLQRSGGRKTGDRKGRPYALRGTKDGRRAVGDAGPYEAREIA